MSRITLSPEWRAGLQAYIRLRDWETIASAADVHRTTIYAWISGRIKSMTEEQYTAIDALISPVVSGLPSPKVYSDEVSPIQGRSTVESPLVGTAMAANWESSMQSFEDFIGDAVDDTYPLPDAKPGDFCMRVEGWSMAPEYVPGDIVICTSKRLPERGEKVVAIMVGGEVVVKTYRRKDNVITLEALNHDDGISYSWHVKEWQKSENFATRMFPVRRALIDEEAHRKARCRG